MLYMALSGLQVTHDASVGLGEHCEVYGIMTPHGACMIQHNIVDKLPHLQTCMRFMTRAWHLIPR